MFDNCLTFMDATGLFAEEEPVWQEAPRAPAMDAQGIHVWRIELETDDDILRTFLPLLSADEVLRAERFRFEKERRHFIVAKGARRVILSRYVGIEPQRVRFGDSAGGKPHVIGSRQPICFSASRSGSLGLIAVANSRRIGVDVENLQRRVECAAIASAFFAPLEAEQIRSLQGEEETEAFFACWTAKEAYLKAVGSGLSHAALQSVSLPVQKRSFPTLFRLSVPMTINEIYRGVRFCFAENYIATLIVED